MYKNEDVKFNKDDIIDHNSVGAIVTNEFGEILVEDHIKYNFFTLPIGKAHLNEDLGKILKKELFEECNIEVLSLKEIARITKEDIREGHKVRMGIILFEITDWTGNIYNKEPHKHRSVMFMSVEKIREITNNGRNTSWMTELFLEHYSKIKIR